MKLEIRDGRVGADMSEPNSAFVFSTREAFTGPASVPFRYADIAPVALPIIGVGLVVTVGVKFFKRIASKA